jgi:phosphoenolpyruvate carboxylase
MHMALQGDLQQGSLALTFERLAAADIRAADIVRTLEHAYISPVLTAHPTEVQRKSILDAERAIAELVEQRDHLRIERERADNEALIRARVTQLWQTRMLRNTKLTVADEIENALSYYQSTFLRQIPRMYRDIEAALPGHADRQLLPHGQLDRRRPRRQPLRHRRHLADCTGAAKRDSAALLPDRSAPARR